MGFDPDAYLASSGGFDPDAYLGAKKGPALDPSRYARAGNEVRGVLPRPPEPTLGERIGQTVKTIGSGVGALRDAAMHPVDTFTNKARVSNLVRGVDDMVTLGYGQKLGDYLADTGPVRAARKWVGLGESPTEEDLANEARFRTGGNLIGAFVPGAANAAGKAGAKLAGKILPQAAVGTGRVASAAAGAARGGIGYAAAAAPVAAGQALARGDSPVDAARDAVEDPVGMGLAVLGGGAGGLARGQAARWRDPKTIEGRTVGAVERAGGEIRPLGEPVRGGLYESPELSSVKEGRAGMNELAGNARDTIKGHNRTKLKEARAAYGQDVDAVLAEHADKAHLAENAHAVLDKLEADNTLSTGKSVSDAVARRLADIRSKLTTETTLDAAGSAEAGAPTYHQVPAVKVADMIKVKKFVSDRAEWGRPATPANRRYRLLSEALNQDAAAVDPRIREINATYAKTMGQLQEANDILFQRRHAEAPKSAAADKRAALKLGRIGDDGQAGTTDALGKLGALDPAYAEQLRLLEAKKALERLRYGEPEVSTSLEKGVHRAASHAGKHVAGAVLGHAAGGPIGAALGTAISSVVPANPLALKLRLGLPAAEVAGHALTGSSGPAVNRLVDLQQARRRDQQRMIDALLGAQ